MLAALLVILCNLPYTACADLRIDEHAGRAIRLEREFDAIGDPLGDVFETRIRAPVMFVLPAKGVITSYFGNRTDPLHKGAAYHEGIDIAEAAGSAVRAAGAGLVTRAGPMGGCGIGLVIEHGAGLSTRYCHLAAAFVHRGKRVTGGEPVGIVGSSGRSTGPHLHFEVRDHGRPVDPVERLYL